MKLTILLTSILLFVISLENYGKTPLIFALVTSLIIPFFYGGKKVKYISLFFSSLALFIVILLPHLSSIETITFKENIHNYNYFDFVFSSIIKLCVSFMLVFLLITDRRGFVKGIDCVIICHLIVFFIQFFTSHIFGFYLDVLHPVTGEYQRYESLMSLPVVGEIFRCTGFYNEPSLYASFMFCFVFLKVHLDSRLGWIGILAILSIFLTFSLAPIVVTLLFVLIYVFKQIGDPKLKFGLVLFTFISLYPLYLLGSERVEATRFSPIAIRVNLINEVFAQSIPELLFGNGPLGVPDTLSRFTRGEIMLDNQLASFPDAGAWLFIIMKFGFLSLVLYIFIMFSKIKGKANRMIFLLVLLTKMNFLYVFYIAFSFIVFCGGRQKR